MKYILWDIDGTLLKTGLAGVDALKDAISDIFNIQNFTFSHPLAGMTDSFIFRQIIKDVTGDTNHKDVTRLLKSYHLKLENYLPTHLGELMPNVKKTLSYCDKHSDIFTTALLTGNTSIGATLKLKYYGIDQYFAPNLRTCGELHENRSELAKIAFNNLWLQNAKLTPKQIYIIGDTPNDILCAQAINARSIVVLAGSTYSKNELAPYNPWKIINTLPDTPADFNLLLEND